MSSSIVKRAAINSICRSIARTRSSWLTGTAWRLEALAKAAVDVKATGTSAMKAPILPMNERRLSSCIAPPYECEARDYTSMHALESRRAAHFSDAGHFIWDAPAAGRILPSSKRFRMGAHALAQSIPHRVRRRVVRGPVLPAAPVRLSRGGGARCRAADRRPHGRHGAAPVRDDDDRRRTRAPPRDSDGGSRSGLSAVRLASREARARPAADHLSLLVPQAHARACGGRDIAFRPVVPGIQRSARRAPQRDRGARDREAFLAYCGDREARLTVAARRLRRRAHPCACIWAKTARRFSRPRPRRCSRQREPWAAPAWSSRRRRSSR